MTDLSAAIMKLIFTSYASSSGFDQPELWLKRIEGYTGILEYLSKDHIVIGIERINYEGEYEQNGVHYYFIKLKKPVVLFPWRMHRLIKGLAPDVVFVNGFVFPLQIIQLRMKLGRRVKIVVINRSEHPSKGIKKYWQKLADTCITAYLFTSAEFGKKWTGNGNIRTAKKIYEVMHGSSSFQATDKTIAREKLSVTGSPVFLWVGRLIANKDPLTVVKAFIRFLELQPSANLYMIYQTEELLNEIKILVNSNPEATEAIRLVGSIPHPELQTWYSSADFIISGSHYEGGGIAVCEAMSCGCIPILTNIIAFRAITGNGKCGLLHEPGDVMGLLAALSKTRELDMEKERSNVLQQFRDELSFEAIAKKINRIIVS